MIPVGISMASVILVGSNIGIRNIQHAQDYARISTCIAILLAIGNVTLVNLTIDKLIHLFSSSPQVNNIIQKAYPILSIFVFFDCLQGVA